ncbi:MAG TPA: hypothetical protein VM282_04205 [Acidimicrobiales bacterium]|nr:hypothetical protein [Acidimicrobiales bacterium]
MGRLGAWLLAVAVAGSVYLTRWAIRTASMAPGLSDQRPTRASPGANTARERARLAAYSARRFDPL